jgi:fumarate reductase subunit C
MGIIRNIQNNIVVIYEIKSLYVILTAGKYFPNNIHRANYHFTHSKKLKKKPIIPPYYSCVVLCTVKKKLKA